MKETLPFKDENDLAKKIREDKEFRIKVQKLVYLSKFFGWNNSYHFNLHERGPYSVELAHDYQNLTGSIQSTSLSLQTDSFKDFIKNQTNEFLEATSTILYYLIKIKPSNLDKNKVIEILSYIKPHLSKNVVENSFKRISEYNLIDYTMIKQKNDLNKKIVNDKLDGLTSIFKNFEVCSNQTIILGSIDYFKIALKRENLKEPEKTELLNVIYDYGEFIENFYFKNYFISDDFSNFDLTYVNKKFDKLQDNISNLKVLPRLYDENVDLEIFLE